MEILWQEEGRLEEVQAAVAAGEVGVFQSVAPSLTSGCWLGVGRGALTVEVEVQGHREVGKDWGSRQWAGISSCSSSSSCFSSPPCLSSAGEWVEAPQVKWWGSAGGPGV